MPANGRRAHIRWTVALVVVASACGSPGVVPPGATGPPPVSLEALPECEPPPRPDAFAVASEWLLPPGAYITAVEEDGPLTVANGWAPMTPQTLRAFYDAAPAGWEPLTTEDEIVEAEVLLSSAETRLFVQAIAACPEGAHLYVRAIPEARVGRD